MAAAAVGSGSGGRAAAGYYDEEERNTRTILSPSSPHIARVANDALQMDCHNFTEHESEETSKEDSDPESSSNEESKLRLDDTVDLSD